MENLNMGSDNVKQFKYNLTFGKTKVIMTEEEWESLNELFRKYTEKHGVTFGFVRWLLEGKSID